MKRPIIGVAETRLKEEGSGTTCSCFIIHVCHACQNLEGEMCHEPSCVFCRRTMEEVADYLDALLIRPIVEGERLGPLGAVSEKDVQAILSRSEDCIAEEEVDDSINPVVIHVAHNIELADWYVVPGASNLLVHAFQELSLVHRWYLTDDTGALLVFSGYSRVSGNTIYLECPALSATLRAIGNPALEGVRHDD